MPRQFGFAIVSDMGIYSSTADKLVRETDLQQMTDTFRAAKLARNKRTRFWRDHIQLAYATVLAAFVLIYLGVSFVSHRIPTLLTALGVSPSGVNLIVGTISCGFGVWGIRKRKELGAAWSVIFLLCLVGGMLSIAKAFAFI